MSTSYRDAVRQLRRDRLLDAGRERLGDRAWADVTMAEIAAAAGVSRQTLYNEFGSRDAFGQALLIREGSRFLDAVEQAIDEHSRDPLAALTAALEGFLTTQRRPILNSARRRLVEAIDAHWPGAAARDLDALADALVRLAISHVAAPHLPPAQTAASITRLLAPAIERMLKGGGEPAA